VFANHPQRGTLNLITPERSARRQMPQGRQGLQPELGTTEPTPACVQRKSVKQIFTEARGVTTVT